MNQDILKQCNECKEWKPLSEFFRSKKTRDGLQHKCKFCGKKLVEQWRENNREQYNALARKFRHDHPEMIAENNHNYYQQHAEEIKEQAKQWYYDHPDRVLERNQEWRKQNPQKKAAQHQRRRANKLGNGGEGITNEQWIEILEKYHYHCAACGSTENLTMDHIVPLSKGGIHDPSNVQPLCKECNFHKHTKTIDYR